MGRLRIVRDVCQGVLGRYEVVVKEGEARLREYERWGEGPSVDELVCAGSVVHNQSVFVLRFFLVPSTFSRLALVVELPLTVPPAVDCWILLRRTPRWKIRSIISEEHYHRNISI